MRETEREIFECRSIENFPSNTDLSLKKEVATHASILAWRIPWTEESGSLQSMELQE